MSEVTAQDVQALTTAVDAMSSTIVNTFAFDLETFAYINGMAMIIFIGGFSLGVVVKRFKQT